MKHPWFIVFLLFIAHLALWWLAWQVHGLRMDVARLEAQRVTREVVSEWRDGQTTIIVRTPKWLDETPLEWRTRHAEAILTMGNLPEGQ